MRSVSFGRVKVFASATLTLCLPLVGVCQSYDVDLVQSVRDAPVRLRPAANAETTFTAAKGTTLVWAAHMDSDGYYRVVRQDKGPIGWVAAEDVRVTHEHEHGARTGRSRRQSLRNDAGRVPGTRMREGRILGG